ncbi:hypothetical protein [Thalassospira xiamenensis]|uniref:Uncharacterized protein n=1 Tax=Thalassospira xiamenensis TaxID=220697 RepID=A0A285TZH1_9PROT|nr:hypothetical protein [Thalassospira xiamenensis]SOC30951.1 hypothetical protein SAMN05428964_11129 [Thalassospira xiamenensis]
MLDKMESTPTKPGLFWAVLDNGEGGAEIHLLRVRFFEGAASFEDGILCEFVDGSEKSFELKNFVQEIVQPSKVSYAASRGATLFEQVKITWHGEAEPPLSAIKQKAKSVQSPNLRLR